MCGRLSALCLVAMLTCLVGGEDPPDGETAMIQPLRQDDFDLRCTVATPLCGAVVAYNLTTQDCQEIPFVPCEGNATASVFKALEECEVACKASEDQAEDELVVGDDTVEDNGTLPLAEEEKAAIVYSKNEEEEAAPGYSKNDSAKEMIQDAEVFVPNVESDWGIDIFNHTGITHMNETSHRTGDFSQLAPQQEGSSLSEDIPFAGLKSLFESNKRDEAFVEDYHQPSEGSLRCSLYKVTGNCRALYIRWWYNELTKECETFSYGGCGGNMNNFGTKEQCQAGCPDERICPDDNSLKCLVSESECYKNCTMGTFCDKVCHVEPCSCRVHYTEILYTSNVFDPSPDHKVHSPKDVDEIKSGEHPQQIPPHHPVGNSTLIKDPLLWVAVGAGMLLLLGMVLCIVWNRRKCSRGSYATFVQASSPGSGGATPPVVHTFIERDTTSSQQPKGETMLILSKT